MDRPWRGLVRSRTKKQRLKKRIDHILQIEKVAYEMEIARRIDVRIHRTIKKVLDTMHRQGELDRSDVGVIRGNIKIRFYWKVGTDAYTVRRVSEFKKHILREHMIYSTAQKRFGPKLAITSLKALAESGDVPLNPKSIKGPLKKWSGPDGEWSESPIVKPYGDIDVLALQSDGERLWLGEVKMRGDLLKQVQVVHFRASAIRFKLRIFADKGIDSPLKLFMLVPMATASAKEYCLEKSIELLECERAYFPSKTHKWGDLSSFYKMYKKVMGFKNLKLVSPRALPVDELTEVLRPLGDEDLPDTV